MAVLAALSSVDWIVPFTEDTPERLLALLVPDVLVKGGDYTEEQVVGAELVKKYGGEIAVMPLEEGCSTSAMIDRIENK